MDEFNSENELKEESFVRRFDLDTVTQQTGLKEELSINLLHYFYFNCEEVNKIKKKYTILCKKKKNQVLPSDICTANDILLMPFIILYFRINRIITYDKYFQFVVLFSFFEVNNIMRILLSSIGIHNDNNISAPQVLTFLKSFQCNANYMAELYNEGQTNPDHTLKYCKFQQWIADYHPNILSTLTDIRKKVIKHNLGKRTTDNMNYRIENIAAIELYKSLNDQKFPYSCCEKFGKLLNPNIKSWSEYDFDRPLNLHLYDIILEMRKSYGFGKDSQIHRAVKSYVFSCERSDNKRVIGHSLSILSAVSRPSRSCKIVPGIFSNDSNV